MTEPDNGKPMMWHYHAGEWSKVPDPIEEMPGNYQEALKALGFDDGFGWGYPASTIKIYEHSTEPEHYRIDVCLDAENFHTIEVTQLPDILDVLAKIAPMAMVDGLSYVAEHPRDVLAAEQQRRRPRR